MTAWTETQDGVLVNVRAQPRSSKSEIDGLLGDVLKVRLKGAPVDGQANEELVRLFAKTFHLPKSSVVIKSGATAKTKTILLRSRRVGEIAYLMSRFLSATLKGESMV